MYAIRSQRLPHTFRGEQHHILRQNDRQTNAHDRIRKVSTDSPVFPHITKASQNTSHMGTRFMMMDICIQIQNIKHLSFSKENLLVCWVHNSTCTNHHRGTYYKEILRLDNLQPHTGKHFPPPANHVHIITVKPPTSQ